MDRYEIALGKELIETKRADIKDILPSQSTTSTSAKETEPFSLNTVRELCEKLGSDYQTAFVPEGLIKSTLGMKIIQSKYLKPDEVIIVNGSLSDITWKRAAEGERD